MEATCGAVSTAAEFSDDFKAASFDERRWTMEDEEDGMESLEWVGRGDGEEEWDEGET